MKFTKEEKMAFVKRYQDGETVLSICNENQIPRGTFYRWIQVPDRPANGAVEYAANHLPAAEVHV